MRKGSRSGPLSFVLLTLLSSKPHQSADFCADKAVFRANPASGIGTRRAYPSAEGCTMDSGFYAASTALTARTATLDTIANNLANASTAGFRAQRDVFSSVLANAGTASTSPLDPVINSYGILSGTMVDVKQGALQKTGNDLDLAIEGKGYFTVQTADGQQYTRNGEFQISSKGQLVNSTGDAVLGDTNLPITLPPGAVSISADGTISSNGAVAGKLKIVEFPAGTELS